MSDHARAAAALTRLLEIMDRLRGPGGCPWDREQTLGSLRPYLLEEAFEVLEEMDRAVESDVWEALGEELGDLLFQIVFQARLARERGDFDFARVCDNISDKLERRHPHVFVQGTARTGGALADAPATSGAPSASGPDLEALNAQWARLKAQERKKKHGREPSALDGVPSAAPALLRAERLTEKASRIGFDWRERAGVRAKLDEELRELDEAVAKGERGAIADELGDVLFTVVNLARHLQVPPEDALRGAITRFERRFRRMEPRLSELDGEAPYPSEALEPLWDAAKEAERKRND